MQDRRPAVCAACALSLCSACLWPNGSAPLPLPAHSAQSSAEASSLRLSMPSESLVAGAVVSTPSSFGHAPSSLLATTSSSPSPCHPPDRGLGVCSTCLRSRRSIFVSVDRILLFGKPPVPGSTSSQATAPRSSSESSSSASSAVNSDSEPSATEAKSSNRRSASTKRAKTSHRSSSSSWSSSTLSMRLRSSSASMSSPTSLQNSSATFDNAASSVTANTSSSSTLSSFGQLASAAADHPQTHVQEPDLSFFASFYYDVSLDVQAHRFTLFDSNDISLWQGPLSCTHLLVFSSPQAAHAALVRRGDVLFTIPPEYLQFPSTSHPSGVGSSVTVEFRLWYAPCFESSCHIQILTPTIMNISHCVLPFPQFTMFVLSSAFSAFTSAICRCISIQFFCFTSSKFLFGLNLSQAESKSSQQTSRCSSRLPSTSERNRA